MSQITFEHSSIKHSNASNKPYIPTRYHFEWNILFCANNIVILEHFMKWKADPVAEWFWVRTMHPLAYMSGFEPPLV